MPSPNRDEILASRCLRVQGASLSLRRQRAVSTGSSQAEDIICITSDNKHGSRRGRGCFETAFDGQQLSEADRVHLVEIGLEDGSVKGAGSTPEIATSTKLRRCDKVAWWEASEAGGVYVCRNENCLREIDGDWDARDTVAGEDESGNVTWVVGCLRVAEDGAVRVTDEDDLIECFTYNCVSRQQIVPGGYIGVG